MVADGRIGDAGDPAPGRRVGSRERGIPRALVLLIAEREHRVEGSGDQEVGRRLLHALLAAAEAAVVPTRRRVARDVPRRRDHGIDATRACPGDSRAADIHGHRARGRGHELAEDERPDDH